MSAIKKGIDEEPSWTMTYFIYLITCIESGYLNDAQFKGILKKKADAAEAHRGTSSSKMKPWESALVKASANQMVAVCMMFSDVHTQYLQRAINAVMEPSLVWHEDQAWCLRSCAKSLEWLTDQLNHKFMALLSDTMKPLGRQDACKHIGFQMPQSVIEGQTRILNEVELAIDDDLAEKAHLALLQCGGNCLD